MPPPSKAKRSARANGAKAGEYRKLGITPPNRNKNKRQHTLNMKKVTKPPPTTQFFSEVKFETEEECKVQDVQCQLEDVKEEPQDFEDDDDNNEWDSTTDSFNLHDGLTAQKDKTKKSLRPSLEYQDLNSVAYRVKSQKIDDKDNMFPCLLCCEETEYDFSWLDNIQDKYFMVMFILKKMMQVPSTQLQEYLRLIKIPSGMIQVCSQCLPEVTHAFAVQQEISRLEETLRKFQKGMRDKIKATYDVGKISKKLLENAVNKPRYYSILLQLTKETRQFIATGIWPSSNVDSTLVVGSTAQSSSCSKSKQIESPTTSKFLKKVVPPVADSEDDDFSNSDSNGDDFQNPLSPVFYDTEDTNKPEKNAAVKTSLVRRNCQEKFSLKKEYKCILCPNLTMQGAQSFVEHILYHYDRPYKCSECEAFLTGNPLELKHFLGGIKVNKEGIKETHKCTMGNLVKITFETGKIWGCAYCSEAFHLESDRDAHEGELHGSEVPVETPLSCSGCSKKLRATDDSWRLHRAVEHPQLARFGCLQCNDIFKLQSYEGHDILDYAGLREHVAKSHKLKIKRGNTTRYYGCDVCGANFPVKSKLANHFEECHGIDKNADLFPCRLCFKRFPKSKTLLRHTRHSHLKKRKSQTFICDLCAYQTTTHVKFLEHKFLVHGIEPEAAPQRQIYTCKEADCSFKCVIKGNFEVHMMKVHNAERRYKCKFCGKGFLNSAQLARHEAIHSNANNKPFQCEICGNNFAVKTYLYIHMRLSHQNRPFQSTRKKRFSKRKAKPNDSSLSSSQETLS